MSQLAAKKVYVGTENEKDALALEQILNQELVNDGHVLIDLETANQYVDKDIHINLTVPSAADPSLDVTDITSSIDMGSASNGVYEPVATISGVANIATAGWISTGDKNVSESNVKIGKVNQSVLKNGNAAIDSGDKITPQVSAAQTINITEGYNGARTVIVQSMDDEDTQKATVVSSNITINANDVTPPIYDGTNHKFNFGCTKEIAAPSVTTPGFISSSAGTKNAGTATANIDVDEITVGVTITGDGTVKPSIARTAKPGEDTWVDAASGAATTTKPSSGAYVQVDAAAVSKSASVVGKVSAAGYGDTTNYQADAVSSVTAGSSAADSTYIPIAAGSVASGSAEIGSVNIDYDSTGGNFNVTGSANIPAPSVSIAGYVGNEIGTLSGATNGATVDASIAKIGISATISGGNAVTPIINKESATNVDASAATTTQPSAGFYIAVKSAADSSSVTAAAAVTSAGYGTATDGQYTTVGDSATITVNASAETYIPITAATFANSATNGVTYADASDVIVPTGGYFYVNEGYTTAKKYSLASIIPNEANVTVAEGSSFILAGTTVYDKDGALITGSIQTYGGAYTIS